MADSYTPGRIDFRFKSWGQVKEPDPWVVVGTTTIDGLATDVVARLGSTKPLVDYVDDWKEPREVGGQMLRFKGKVDDMHVDWTTGVVCIRCDIVRRQSEVDAEAHMRPCINCEEHLCDTQFCEACVDGFRAMEPPCPECGPHGNAGRVLGADIWYPCTLCAGGYPGDMHETERECDGRDEDGLSCASRWGGPEDCPKCFPGRTLSASLIAKGASSEVAQQGVRAFVEALSKTTTRRLSLDPKAVKTQVHFASGRSRVFDVPLGCNEVEVDDSTETVTFGVAGSGMLIPPLSFDPVGHKPGGFVVPGRAELENYLKAQYLSLAPVVYDDATIAQWRDFIEAMDSLKHLPPTVVEVP